MPYETRSRTGKKPAPVPVLDFSEEPQVLAKTTRKKTATEGKSTDKKGKGRTKTASKSSKSSDSSSSNPGTLRRKPKDLPVLTEDEEEEVFSEPVAPEDPMQNHRQHYRALTNLLEAYTDNTEEDELSNMYDALAVRTRRAMKTMERLNEKHKDDPQSILAKTPLGKKMGLKSLKEEGSDEEDLFEDSVSKATSVASVSSSVASKSGGAVVKTPARKLRPRKRKSVVVAKSPWRQNKVVKAKKKKSMKKKKRAINFELDLDSSASTQVSNHQDEAPPPPPLLQVQPSIKKAQKRPVETTPQKTIFSVPSEFDFGQKVPEPSSKKRILEHPAYKFAKDPTLGNKTDKPKIADTKSKKLPSQGSSSSNGEATKQEKRAKASKEVNQAAVVASEDKKSMETKTKEQRESKDVPPKKIKKLTKTEIAGAKKSNDIQAKVSQPLVQKATAPEAAVSKLAEEEPDLFETPESLKPAGASKASVPSVSSKSSSTSSHTSQDVKKSSVQRQASAERHVRISSQKTPRLYDATFVVSDDEPMQTPPHNKVTPGSSGVRPGLCDGTFVVQKKTAIERKPSTDSYPSKAGNSTPGNIGNSTFVVPATAVAPKEPVDGSSKEKNSAVTPSGSGSERSAQATTTTKKVPSGALNVKPTKPFEQPASSVAVEKSLHPKLSGKEKIIANQARKGSAASSSTSSSGDSQASVKTASSVMSGKSHANPAGKLLLPRQSPGMAKDYGLNKLPVADPEVERKRQEEKQRKAEEKKNQFIQQKRDMQKKINEEWKAKLEKKKEEDARQADEKNKIQSGVVQVGVKVATLPFKNVVQAGAMTAASSCPDVSKKYGTVPGSSAMKQKDVYGSVGQLVAGSSKVGTGVKIPSKPSPKKPAAAKPAVIIHPPPSAPVLKAPVVAPAKAPIHQDHGFFERSLDDGDGDESFATADTTMDERNENVNNYEITVYEDLDDNMKHRENKRIPAWAADEDQLNMALFLQQPDLMRLIRKPMFPQKNIGFKIFPDVAH